MKIVTSINYTNADLEQVIYATNAVFQMVRQLSDKDISPLPLEALLIDSVFEETVPGIGYICITTVSNAEGYTAEYVIDYEPAFLQKFSSVVTLLADWGCRFPLQQLKEVTK